MKISMELSESSIDDAIKKLDAYISQLEKRCDELCRRLALLGVDAAVAGLGYHEESSELRNSIRFEKVGDKEYLVVADCGYAVYVEFGTGVVGSNGTYPAERPSWAGVPNGDKESWVYYDEKLGITRVTSGIEPVAFMAKSTEEMRQSVLSVAKEVFAA